MTNNPSDNIFWNKMTDEMRRSLHLSPLSDEQAETEYDDAPEVPMTPDQIVQYTKIASAAVPREPSYEERTTGNKAIETIDIEVGEVLGLHRNEGELDPEVEEEMRRQREEALSDEDEGDEDDKNTDES